MISAVRPTGHKDRDNKGCVGIIGGIDRVCEVQGREVEGRAAGMVGLDVVDGHDRRSGYCCVCA